MLVGRFGTKCTSNVLFRLRKHYDALYEQLLQYKIAEELKLILDKSDAITSKTFGEDDEDALNDVSSESNIRDNPFGAYCNALGSDERHSIAYRTHQRLWRSQCP